MNPSIPSIQSCLRPHCGFRFPLLPGMPVPSVCPKCGGPLQTIENPYAGAVSERSPDPDSGPVLEVLLDNIRSTYNVGSAFRTADGAGIRHIHLCGVTPPPDHPKVAKTALGSEFSVPWSQHWNAVAAAEQLREEGLRIWALEAGPGPSSLFESLADLPGPPLLLAVGNEVSGVDPGILDLCERRIEIPMQGVKGSLNVSTAFGIAVYFVRYGYRIRSSPTNSTT
jgi:tRNA G18 (ribose-2'-O)-methylase SpoU